MTLRASLEVQLGTLQLAADIEARRGQILAVLGPNGAGKTTLLRALAGLVPLRAGRVELDGQVLADVARHIRLPPERRAIGFVFQDHVLFPHLNALDNVAFGLRARRAADASVRALEWLRRFGLETYATSRPAALSGGQAQRVALARALALNPRLLLLDEPFAALDATSRATMRAELKPHLESFAGVGILVSHDADDVRALADRVVILDCGRVVASGSVSGLLSASTV